MKRIEVRSSGVHGQGVFARAALRAGDRVGWYAGEVISSDEADRRFATSDNPDHTMFFTRSDGQVIDGAVGGNHTRFLNHGCDPNCHAEEHPDGSIAIVATSSVPPGAELLIDYHLQVDPDAEDGLYDCRCASPQCRGTMVAGTVAG